MQADMLSPVEIDQLRRAMEEGAVQARAEFRRLKARSIAQEIADLEDTIDRMGITSVMDKRFAAAWVLREKIDHLRMFVGPENPTP